MKRLRGEVTPPGDKSISHRALILGALAVGDTHVRGLNPGADVASTMSALRQVGVDIRAASSTECVVVGKGGAFRSASTDVHCGNSGTTMRLLAGVLAAREGVRARLVGDGSLSARPMERVAGPLRQLGAAVDTTEGRPPLVVRGGALVGTAVHSEVASAQVKSAVLLAALSAVGTTEFGEPMPSRDHTERMLARMGADIRTSPREIRVRSGRRLQPLNIDVPGDPSAAAFYVVAASMATGSDITVRDVGVNPTRLGFLNVLRRMGARISVMNVRDGGGEPVADLHVEAAALQATVVGANEVPALVDEVPIVAIAAAGATGTTSIRGAGELRLKESDRLRALADGLGRLGVDVTEVEDGLDIVGTGTGTFGAPGATVEIAGGSDHRIAMSFRVAGLLSRSEVRVSGDGSSAISDPEFGSALTRLALG